jgi:flagellin
MYAQREVKFTNRSLQKNIEKLSSGMRINRASDDAANLAVSEKMRSQIRGLHQAGKNTQDGISFIQTVEGNLIETTQILQRLRELSIQSANGVYTSEDREQIQVEVSQLIDEIDRIAQTAQFNTLKMLEGQYAKRADAQSMFFHVGANENERYRVYIGTMNSEGLYLRKPDKTKEDVLTIANSNKMIAVIDNALKKVSKQRADLGAYQNRMEHTLRNLAVSEENLQAAESRIRDTDMAEEMVDFVKNQILVQSGMSMLAQANVKPQAVLQLLR